MSLKNPRNLMSLKNPRNGAILQNIFKEWWSHEVVSKRRSAGVLDSPDVTASLQSLNKNYPINIISDMSYFHRPFVLIFSRNRA